MSQTARMTRNRNSDSQDDGGPPAGAEGVASQCTGPSTDGDLAIVAAWAALRGRSQALTGATLRDKEIERLCAEVDHLQAVISQTPARTLAGLAIKLRCVLESLVDERAAHAAAVSGGVPDEGYIAKAGITEQMLWYLLVQIEASAARDDPRLQRTV